jgi:transcriptional regulator with XRE-family HTH domain
MDSIGKALRTARIAAGLSLGAAARLAAMSPAHLSQIEQGRSASPHFATVAKICAIIGVSLDSIATNAGMPGFSRNSNERSLQSGKVSKALQEIRVAEEFNSKVAAAIKLAETTLQPITSSQRILKRRRKR